MRRFFLTIAIAGTLIFSGLLSAENRLVFAAMIPDKGQGDTESIEIRLTREVFKRAGHDIAVHFYPWQRALKEAELGQIDGIIGVWYNDERAKIFEYSDSFLDHKVVFFKRKDRDIAFSNLKDLKGYVIGVVNGWIYSDEFDQASYLTKAEVTERKQNLEMLIHGRIDLTPDLEFQFKRLLKHEFPNHLEEIEAVGEPLAYQKLYTIVSKAKSNHKTLIEVFNRKLREVREDGSFDKIVYQ